MIYIISAAVGLIFSIAFGIGAFKPEDLLAVPSITAGLMRMSGGGILGIALTIVLSRIWYKKRNRSLTNIDWVKLIYIQAGITTFWTAFVLYFYETSKAELTSIPLTFTALASTVLFLFLTVRRI